MRTAHISRRQAEASFDYAASDDEVFAVQAEAAMSYEREEIDRLLDEVDRDLVAEERAEGFRLLLDVTDHQRPRRTRRRGERAALRALPTRLAELFESEAA